MKNLSWISLLILLFVSCNKDIDVFTPNSSATDFRALFSDLRNDHIVTISDGSDSLVYFEEENFYLEIKSSETSEVDPSNSLFDIIVSDMSRSNSALFNNVFPEYKQTPIQTERGFYISVKPQSDNAQFQGSIKIVLPISEDGLYSLYTSNENQESFELVLDEFIKTEIMVTDGSDMIFTVEGLAIDVAETGTYILSSGAQTELADKKLCIDFINESYEATAGNTKIFLSNQSENSTFHVKEIAFNAVTNEFCDFWFSHAGVYDVHVISEQSDDQFFHTYTRVEVDSQTDLEVEFQNPLTKQELLDLLR